MINLECLSVNESGHLCIGGVDTVELSREYDTPLFVMDENSIRNSCKIYKEVFQEYYSGNGLPLFASKAMSCKEVLRIMKSEGMGLDVVSAGELYTALMVDFPMDKVQFHGNNKTVQELEMSVDNGVGRIVADNIHELETLNSIALSKGVKAKVILRVKPGVEAHTHSFIKTGQIDSKFGFALETGEALEVVRKVIELKGLELMGLHCHIGSQIVDVEPFVHTATVMMEFINQIKNSTGKIIGELNLGGGFGIRYTKEDKKVDYKNYIGQVLNEVKKKSEEFNIPQPFVYLEPGRSIVGEAGVTLYKVGGVKDIPNVRTYVSVDGGMTDNPRYALYQSSYTIVNAVKANETPDKCVTIAGKCCESGDIIQKDVFIKSPDIGDIIAVLCTGAYNYSMASNYNRIPKPAVVIVKDGVSRLAVKRQTLDDLIKNDI